MYACTEIGLEGNSLDAFACPRKFPDAFRPGMRSTGSFDCVVIRCADDNFAQDDK
jgi:hypothetical protein